MDNGNGNGGIIGRLSAASPSFVPSVALDLTTEEREKLLAVIGSQFDLEILLKYREVKALENELERVQELKGLVQKLILNGTMVSCHTFRPSYPAKFASLPLSPLLFVYRTYLRRERRRRRTCIGSSWKAYLLVLCCCLSTSLGNGRG
jgi:hypothetical protein